MQVSHILKLLKISIIDYGIDFHSEPHKDNKFNAQVAEYYC
jgi:hypothetical protein